jgi:hypothetical protein
MMSFTNQRSALLEEKRSIEFYIRYALAFGELSTQAEAEIHRLATQGEASPRECTLLAVLRDAIQDGCVRRV